MLKQALAASLIAGAMPSAAVAETVKVEFGTADGGHYCATLIMDIKGKIARTQFECEGVFGDYRGGFLSDFYGSGVNFGMFQIMPKTQVWSITTGDTENLGSSYVEFSTSILPT
jgi:hypothetical protein